MSAWPATLPAPAINSLVESPPANVIRSQPDKGPAMTRARTTANVRPLAFTLMLTKALVQTLDDFYTANAPLEFTYNHPRTGAACNARFVSAPVYTEQEGVVYSTAVQLEITP